MEKPSGEQKIEEAKKSEADLSSEQDSDPKPYPSGGGGQAGAQATREADRSEGEMQQTENSGRNNHDNEGDHNKLASSNNISRSKKSVRWSEELVMESPRTMSSPGGSGEFGAGTNPYIAASPTPSYSTSFKSTVTSVRVVLGRWGKNVKETTKKAEDLAGNTWQHLKTSPSLTDAALGRIAQGAKVLAEGGYEKIFRQTFETVPEEQLLNSYACYLSTSAGPVMGVLYLSTAKLAFCSDNPLSYKSGDKTEWSYYKVVVPLHQLKAVNPSSSRANRAEKYIQVISVDNHEFWYMGFLNYDSAVQSLEDALQARDLSA